MPQTLNTRVSSPEESMRHVFTALDALTEKEKKLDDVLVLLTEAQITTQESLRETERRFRETDKRFQETGESFRETDARIDRLVESQMQTDLRFREIGERIENLVNGIGALLRYKQ